MAITVHKAEASGAAQDHRRVANVNVGDLVRMTAKLPDDKVALFMTRSIENVLQKINDGAISSGAQVEACLSELGAMLPLRDTIGTKTQPGAVRAAIKTPNQLAVLCRHIVTFWSEFVMVKPKPVKTPGSITTDTSNIQVSSSGGPMVRNMQGSEKDVWDLINGQG